MVRSTLAFVAFALVGQPVLAASPASQVAKLDKSLPKSARYHQALREAASSYLRGRYGSSDGFKRTRLNEVQDAAAQLTIRQDVVSNLAIRYSKSGIKANQTIETAKSLVDLLGRDTALRTSQDIRDGANERAYSLKSRLASSVQRIAAVNGSSRAAADIVRRPGLQKESAAAEEAARAADINYSLVKKLVGAN